MQKETIAQKSVYWMKVISLGLILGIGIQIAQAWTPPGANPPGGNVSGPITTSATAQTKDGPLTVKGIVESNAGGAKNGGAFRVGSGGMLHSWGNNMVFTDINGDYYNSVVDVGYMIADTVLITPRICLLKNSNYDCITSWPTGGSGGGGGTTITGGSCGSGTVMNSISAAGVPGCIADAVGGGGGSGITSLSGGTGITLSPNPITTTGTISADTGVIQKRVTGTCSVGNAVTSINADGTVGCGAAGGGGGTTITGGPCGPGQVVKSISAAGVISCGSVAWTEVTNKAAGSPGSFSHVVNNVNPNVCNTNPGGNNSACGAGKKGFLTVNSNGGNEALTGFDCICYWQ